MTAEECDLGALTKSDNADDSSARRLGTVGVGVGFRNGASHAREPLDLLHRGGYVCAPAERAPPPVRGGTKWVGWEAEAMLRWLRERDGYAEVRCISKEARTAFWAQE